MEAGREFEVVGYLGDIQMVRVSGMGVNERGGVSASLFSALLGLVSGFFSSRNLVGKGARASSSSSSSSSSDGFLR